VVAVREQHPRERSERGSPRVSETNERAEEPPSESEGVMKAFDPHFASSEGRFASLVPYERAEGPRAESEQRERP